MAKTQPRAGRREWTGLLVLVLPAMIVGMDLTVLHLAVPSISEDLQPSSAQLLWIIDIYGFVLAGALITMGKLGDRIGRRRLLLIGAAAFGVASVVAAFSVNAEMLILMRALLGLAGATVAPSTLSLIRNMFADDSQRTRAISVWFMANLAGNAVGPLLGGLLLEHFWWGSAFLIAVPPMLVLLVAGPKLLPEYRNPAPGRVDPLSAAMALAAVLLVIYGVKEAAENGFRWPDLVAIVAGLAIAGLFVNRQRSLADPMFDLSLLRSPAFTVSFGVLALASLLMIGTGYFGMQFLQLVAHQSTLRAGLWSLPLLAAGTLSVLLTPTFSKRVRPAYVIAGGLVVAAIGFGLLTHVTPDGGLAILIIGFVVIFAGLGPVSTLGVATMVGAAPPERSGVASAMSETGQQFGSALGLAVFGSIGAAVYRNSLDHALPHGIPADLVATVRQTLGAATSAAARLPGQLGQQLLRAARAAFTDGLDVAAEITMVAAVLTAVLTVVLLRNSGGSQPADDRQAEDESADSLS